MIQNYDNLSNYDLTKGAGEPKARRAQSENFELR